MRVFPFVLIPLGFLAYRTAALRARATAASAEVELENHRLTVRSSSGADELRQSDVTELKYLPHGLVLVGRERRQQLELRPELEGYGDLLSKIETWVPASVPRHQAAASPVSWLLAAVLLNLGLLVAAFAVTAPRIAIPCCLLESVILLTCTAWLWRHQAEHKWMTLLPLIPACSLLLRAHALWSAP